MENFYLKLNEELFSIIDRIKRSRDDNITLVIPGGLSALRSIINLRILKEEAISSGKDISIVTSDNLIRKLAQQASLEVLEKEPRDGKNDNWPEELFERKEPKPTVKKRVMSDIVRLRVEEPEIEEEEALTAVGKEPEIEEEIEEPEEEIIHKPKRIRPSFRFFTKKRLIISGVVVCLIVLSFVLYFILPRAQVIISPKKETIRFETEIIADKNIDSINFTNSSIPGQVFQLEMEDSRKFPTTGEKDVEEKAKGIIVVYNEYNSNPQTLVKTTRFLSETGKLFRLIETTIIPGATVEEGKIIASSKEVEVVADEAGETYNIGSSNFTIPGFKESPRYTTFYGRSTEPMTGGAKGKMRVATKDDVEGAMEIVSLELKNEVQEQFGKKIPSNLKLLEDTQILEIVESDSSLKADEPGKEFLITIKVKAWGLAFKEEDAFYLIEKNIGDKISENKKLITSTIQIAYNNVEIDLTKDKADFSCQVEAKAAWVFDEEEIKNNLAGKDEIGVRKYLSALTEIESAKVVFWPFWVKKISKNKNKIKIIIDTE